MDASTELLLHIKYFYVLPIINRVILKFVTLYELYFDIFCCCQASWDICCCFDNIWMGRYRKFDRLCYYWEYLGMCIDIESLLFRFCKEDLDIYTIGNNFYHYREYLGMHVLSEQHMNFSL